MICTGPSTLVKEDLWDTCIFLTEPPPMESGVKQLLQVPNAAVSPTAKATFDKGAVREGVGSGDPILYPYCVIS